MAPLRGARLHWLGKADATRLRHYILTSSGREECKGGLLPQLSAAPRDNQCQMLHQTAPAATRPRGMKAARYIDGQRCNAGTRREQYVFSSVPFQEQSYTPSTDF